MSCLRSLMLCLALVGGSAHALYDPPPEPSLYALQGEWRGTLTYKDYSPPGRDVTLSTTLFVAMSAPSELTLHYTFADGPGKTVWSYERMSFDFAGQQVRWVSGSVERSESVATITADRTEGALRRIVFERGEPDKRERFTLELGTQTLTLQKEELPPAGAVVLRNRFTFRRAGR